MCVVTVATAKLLSSEGNNCVRGGLASGRFYASVGVRSASSPSALRLFGVTLSNALRDGCDELLVINQPGDFIRFICLAVLNIST